MSIHRRAARRDSNEAAIVAALLAAGASVTYLSAPGCPDLLVGIAGRTVLIEVKAPLGPKGGNVGRGRGSSRLSAGGDGTLSADQRDWWATWKGSPPVIVRTVDEALAAIGASPTPILDMVRAAVTDRPDVLAVLAGAGRKRR